MNAIDRIVFCGNVTVQQRDLDRFGLAPLTRAGFAVEFHDYSPALARKQGRKPDQGPAPSGVRRFHDLGEAIDAIENAPDGTLFYNRMYFSPETKPLFEALNRSPRPYAALGVGPSPLLDQRPSLRYRLRKMRDWAPRTLLFSLSTRLARVGFAMRPADLVLWVGGEKGFQARCGGVPAERLVLGHAFDYDIFLALRDEEGPEENMAVFLDEGMVSHPDFAIAGARPFATAEAYYPALRRYFDRLEADNPGLRVVIAAHPRVSYDDAGALFGGRAVIAGDTARLVKRCRLTLLHSSTSVNFPVLWKKPMRFLTTDELAASRAGAWIERLAAAFHQAPLDLSGESAVDTSIPGLVNFRDYEIFQNDSIKMREGEDRSLWDIFANRLRKGVVHARATS